MTERRSYMVVMLDVTGWDDDEIASLELDVVVQSESLDYEDPDPETGFVRGHPGTDTVPAVTYITIPPLGMEEDE